MNKKEIDKEVLTIDVKENKAFLSSKQLREAKVRKEVIVLDKAIDKMYASLPLRAKISIKFNLWKDKLKKLINRKK